MSIVQQPPPFNVPFFDRNGNINEPWQRYLLKLQTNLSTAIAPSDAPFVTTTANATLTAASNLGLLSSGYLKITTAIGIATVLSTATIAAADIAPGTAGINITGNAGTATILQTARNIAGVSFNGSANIALASTGLSDTANIAYLNASNTFTLINPIITAAESWIGPSATTGVYFKFGNVGIGFVPTSNAKFEIRQTGNGAQQLLYLSNAKAAAADVGEELAFTGDLDLRQAVIGAAWNGAATTDGYIYLSTRGSNTVNEAMRITSTGNIGIGVTVPTAALHIKAGTATASTAPLKLTSGTLLTSAEAGAVEFLTDKVYGTITTGAARKEFTLNDSALTSGKIPVATTNGRLTDSTAALQVAAGVPSVVASTFERSETGSDANVLTYTTGGTDEFLAVMVATDVSALTGTSVTVTVTWKDSNNATATTNVTLGGVGDGSINVPINAFTATNVVISTVFVGVTTAYKISAIITRFK